MKEITIDIEVSSACNAHCYYCPHRDILRRNKFLDDAITEKIIPEIINLGDEYDIRLGLCGFGEPLLNIKQVLRILTLLKHERRIKIALLTNGASLNWEMIPSSIFRRLDRVIVSVSGWSKESYEKMSGLDYDLVSHNLVAVKSMLNPRIGLSCVLTSVIDKRRKETQLFWRNQDIPFHFSRLHSRGGWLHKRFVAGENGRKLKSCSIFNNFLFISSDGLVLSCCHDIQQENVIGNCRHDSLNDIMIRKLQFTENNFRICKYCDDIAR